MTYLEILNHEWPGYAIKSNGPLYEDIVWNTFVTETKPTKSELDAAIDEHTNGLSIAKAVGSNIEIVLTNSGVVSGTYGSATHVTPLTVDSKGRVINAGSPVTITPDFNSVTNKPTTMAGYGITDANEIAQDAVASAITAGTHTGVTVAYDDVNNKFSFTGLIKNIYAGSVVSTSGTTTITPGTAAPTTSNGTQIWSQAITPTSINSKFLIRFSCTVGISSTASPAITIAVFRNTTYIGSSLVRADANGDFDGLAIDLLDQPATISSVTYSCRIGTSAGTWFINRRSGENTYGGTNSGWSIMEY